LIQPLSTDKNEILYTYDDTIRSTNRKSDKVTTVTKLDFHPRCFQEVDNLIVSGGVISSVNNSNSMTNLNRSLNSLIGDTTGIGSSWRGLFSLFNKNTQESQTIKLGSYINNNVSINKQSNGQYTSYICNNDMNLYNTDINNTSITIKDTVSLDFPLNHSALSDDGKHLVVVGDSSNIVLLHPDEYGSSSLHRDNLIETPCDSGFSTSFDASGTQFATCFQDGTCLIYDLRMISKGPMKQVFSTRRHSSNGAFRCVKYSRGTDDLLVLSEHVGRVHLIDSRDFNNHQVIMLPVNDNPRSRQASSASLSNIMNGHSRSPSLVENNMIDSINPNIYNPKILEYNDILNYEGNLAAINTFENTFGSTYNTNYNSRNFNNYNLLSAIENDDEDEDEDDDVTDVESSSEDDLQMDEEVSTLGGNILHRASIGSNASATTMASEFDYADNEISGLDWYEDRYGSHIVIGCDKGLINWDIDSWGRRSFPSFKLS